MDDLKRDDQLTEEYRRAWSQDGRKLTVEDAREIRSNLEGAVKVLLRIQQRLDKERGAEGEGKEEG